MIMLTGQTLTIEEAKKYCMERHLSLLPPRVLRKWKKAGKRLKIS
ncbi:hypothetical protein Q5O89_07970 [Peribacillus frigoritolerans]|nr:hypothetical protein [Peribacillus frigoritolerans]